MTEDCLWIRRVANGWVILPGGGNVSEATNIAATPQELVDYIKGWAQEREATLAEFTAYPTALEVTSRRSALMEAADLEGAVYRSLIGNDAVLCSYGNGRVPTGAYREATAAFAKAIRGLTEGQSE